MPGAVDYVFHLASPASPIDYLRLPLHTLKVGSYGTHNALGLAKFKRARFLLASTSEVYGDPLLHPQSEDYWGNVNPIGPRGVYDEAKRYSEAMTMAYHRQQGVDTCHRPHLQHLRPAHAAQRRPRRAHVRAPGARRQADHRVRRRLADAQVLLRHRPGRRALPPGDERGARARQPRQPDRDDAARAGRGASSRRRAARARSSSRRCRIDDPKVRRPDITRARELLDWEPTVTLAEGLAKVVSFTRSNDSHSQTALT